MLTPWVLASARLRGIHPPDNIQNGGRPGGMPIKRALARTHGVMDHGVAVVTQVDLLCALFCGDNPQLKFNLLL